MAVPFGPTEVLLGWNLQVFACRFYILFCAALRKQVLFVCPRIGTIGERAALSSGLWTILAFQALFIGLNSSISA